MVHYQEFRHWFGVLQRHVFGREWRVVCVSFQKSLEFRVEWVLLTPNGNVLQVKSCSINLFLSVFSHKAVAHCVISDLFSISAANRLVPATDTLFISLMRHVTHPLFYSAPLTGNEGQFR